jgi:hypothetical protein
MGFLVTIDKQLISEKYWKEKFIYIYMLDYCTIGISPIAIPEWESKGIPKEFTTEILETRDTYIVNLPDIIVNFYRIYQRKHVVTGHADFVLITVTDRNKQ